MVKRIFSLNFFDSFINGAVTVAIPLLMLEKGIGIETIGLVFAIAPLARLAVRIGSAAMADAIGERVFYFLNAASNLAQSLCYLFFQTPAGFAAGKALDGAQDSFIWAVNRSSIIAREPKKGHFVLGSMIGGREVYFALGSLAVALMVPIAGYGSLFLAAAAISLVMLWMSAKVENTHQRQKIRLSNLTMLGRRRSFYETSSAMILGTAFYSVIIFLLIPIFLSMAGFSLLQIGMLFAAYFLIFGLVLNFISHRRCETRLVAILGAAIFSLALCGMAFGPVQTVPYFFLLMAFGDAQLALVWEHIIYVEVKESARKATDIALLHAPGMAAIVVLSAASGFLASAFGFAPIFIAGALSLAAYAAWSIRLARLKR
jgi:MFS family permease